MLFLVEVVGPIRDSEEAEGAGEGHTTDDVYFLGL